MYCLKARTSFLLGAPKAEVVSAFDRALEVAHSQGAVVLGLQATLEKARYLISIDEERTAQALIDKTVSHHLGEPSSPELSDLLALNTHSQPRVAP